MPRLTGKKTVEFYAFLEECKISNYMPTVGDIAKYLKVTRAEIETEVEESPVLQKSNVRLHGHKLVAVECLI